MNPVSITRNGKTYTGSFSTSGNLLTVVYAGNRKPTQINGMDELVLAKMILGEMIRI